jgi:hypothetical protein
MTMHRQATEALWQIDGRGEREGWDGPSRFYFLLKDRETADLYVTEFSGWQLIGEAAGETDTVDALSTLAAVMRGVGGPDGMEASGVALAVEAWMVRGDPAAVADVAAPSRHPDRIEVRITTAVLADGWRGLLVHERDGAAQAFTTDDDAPEGGRPRGRVVAALARVLAAARE